MASNQCIIDDAYCTAMGTYFKRQGDRLDQMVEDYIAVLKTIRDTGVTKGDIHTVLEGYITYAEKMKSKIGTISENAQSQVNKFLTRVDEADQYLF